MLRLENVTKKYTDFSLGKVSFHLPQGYVMGLIGDNGAGKTTLLKLIMNLLRRDSGSIEIFGLDNQKDEVQIKDAIGFVYDELCYYPHMTVGTTVETISRFYSQWDQSKYNHLAKHFELDWSKKISKLSRGTGMRLMTAIALSHGAKLLILDEPTSGLDPGARRDFLDLLYDELQSGEVSILFSTHITTDLDRIADYVTMLREGEQLFTLPGTELLNKYAMVRTDPQNITTAMSSSFSGYKFTPVGFEGLIETTKLQALPLDPVLVSRPSLEDIMLYYEKEEIHGPSKTE